MYRRFKSCFFQKKDNMIQNGTFLQVVDNLAIKELKSIRILGGLKKKAKLGDFLVTSVKKMIPKKTKDIGLKKGSLTFALVIQTNEITNRLDGQKIKYTKNAAILADKQKRILGSKMDSPIFKEFRKKKSIKFINSSFQTI